MATAIDFSFARPSPQEIVDAGASGILVYTGAARPDADYLTAMRDRGLTVCFVQESSPNRAQAGQNAGMFDAQYADRRADEVGYPIIASICYVVSDGNAADPSSGGDQIAAYANGIARTSRRRFFFYGNTYATQAALSGAPTALGTWVPSTWGPATLLTQEANTPSPVADSDLNTVHAPYGAWGSTALGDDEVTPEQMATLGKWMQETEARTVEKVAAAVGGQNKALWGKYTNLGDLYNMLHKELAELKAVVDKLPKT